MAEKLKPLLYSPSTGEPFLRLPVPHDNIILTPPRLTDAPTIVPLLNDPKVYKFLSGPPHPYLIEHANQFQQSITSACDKVIKEIMSKAPDAFVDGCPIRTLREVQPDGSELFLGDLGVTRHEWPELDDQVERKKLAEVNLARATGDPEIVWEFGDYIRTSHQGRGIMTAAVGTLMKEWMIPRMNAHRIHASIFEGNRASIRVFEKNGFMLKETLKLVREGDFGRIEGMHVVQWEMQ